jgi:hypothetical protein
MWEQAEMLERWVGWAEAEVAGRPDDVSMPPGDGPVRVLRDAAGA